MDAGERVRPNIAFKQLGEEYFALLCFVYRDCFIAIMVILRLPSGRLHQPVSSLLSIRSPCFLPSYTSTIPRTSHDIWIPFTMASLTLRAAALAAFALGVRATTIELPPCIDPFRPFIYSGCYADTGNPHTLSLRSQLDQQDMTIEKCVSVCKGNGFRYAGLEHYGVCYCGNTVNGQQLDEEQCNYPCTGNSSQICGGTDIISIYQDPTFLPVDEVTVADYDHLGCWTDDSENGRALAYPQDQVDGSTLTTEKCLQACRDGGYPFAGTEFGGK